MSENETPKDTDPDTEEPATEEPQGPGEEHHGEEFLLAPKDPPREPGRIEAAVRRRWKTLAGGALALVVAGFVALYLFLGSIGKELPQITRLDDYRPNVITHVYDTNGEKIWEFFKEQRIVMPLEKIPPQVRQAFIAAEDAGFYSHSGIDFFGILRAAVANLRAGGIKQGASTITQQVARSFFLTPERAYVRKLKEVILATRIEERLSKDDILMLYLNQIYLGSGAYGVAAAAEIYYHKTLDELTLSEAATIAGVTPRPAAYAPNVDPELARQRRNYVLGQMLQEKYISQEDYDAALAEKIFAHPRELPEQKWPHMAYAMEEVRKELVKLLGEVDLFRGGLSVVTSFNNEYQKYAHDAARAGIERMDKRLGYRGPVEHVDGEVEQSAWLAASAEELSQKLKREGYNPEDAVAPFEAGEIRTAMVTGFSKRAADSSGDPDIPRAELTLAANQSGTIELPDMAWAREPNENVNPDDAELTDPKQALKIGDIVKVRIVSVAADPVRGAEPLGELYLPAYDYTLSLYQVPVVQGALLSLDPGTGQIRAMIGGYDYETSKFNRSVQALRQPGSAFKPIIFSKALSKGYTASTTILDAPVTYQGASDSEVWKPKNYVDRFTGEVTLREALTRSINTIPVKILMDLGVDYTINYARDLGIESELAHDPTLALGSSSVTLKDLCRAYAAFGNSGYRINATMIEQVRDSDGMLVFEKQDPWHRAADPELPPPAPAARRNLFKVPVDEDGKTFEGEPAHLSTFGPWVRSKFEKMTLEERANRITRVTANARTMGRVASPAASYVMTNLLYNVISRGTGHHAAALGRPAAGKTGTSNDNIDAWFIGYTPSLLAGAWIGFDDRTTLGRYTAGGNISAPMWLDYMEPALAGTPVEEFPVPEGVVFASVDAKSGKLARPDGAGVVFQAFIEGTQPAEYVEDAGKIKAEDFFNIDTDLQSGADSGGDGKPPSAEDILNLP